MLNLTETLTSAVRFARQGNLADATALLKQAEGRSSAPEIDHAWARVLMVAGDRAAAIERFRRYLRRVPADFRARGSLAAELAADGRLAAARRELAEAVANAPPAERPLLFNEFGNALVDSRREDAIAAYTEAVRLAPEHAQMRLNLASTLSLAGQQPAAIYHITLAQTLAPDLLAAADEATYLESQLLALLARAEDPVTQRHHASRLASLRLSSVERLSPASGRPDARLRVGYVSPDFRHHAVATFFAPVLAAHDRTRMEIHLYGEVRSPDAITERLKGMADHWLSTCGLTTRQLAERIRSDGIDVLVDLAGWTVGSRLDAFACRPAGVQLTWLGYAATTGLDSATGLDGRLTDGWADPPGETEEHFSERLIRLPSGFIAQRPLDDAVPPPAPRRRPDSGAIRFGSFNNAAKISAATIALWVTTLNAVPGSRLILKNPALANPYVMRELRDRFVRAGLAAERLELRPSLSAYDDHLRAYDDIDIALDTFPYHGTTTTCEALFQGVPVVTLAGRTHAARVGVSLLSRIGCSDWIAASESAFAAQAAALARDVDRLAELRSRLPQMLRAAPLFDPAAIARDLETLYRQLVTQKGG